MNRQLRKAQNIRRRLGCSESLAEPILTKPKGACGKASVLWMRSRRSGGGKGLRAAAQVRAPGLMESLQKDPPTA